MNNIIHIETITQACDGIGVSKPRHPLVTTFAQKDVNINPNLNNARVTGNLYQIWLSDGVSGDVVYGRHSIDAAEGSLVFLKPGQVLSVHDKQVDPNSKGWCILFHPDLLRTTTLGKTIKDYHFFDYEAHEALHISEQEKQMLAEIKGKIIAEYSNNIDKHSHKLIVANIELLLDYCNRFYDRQFYTRTSLNKEVVTKFEEFLENYYLGEQQLKSGVPTVKICAQALNFSSNYFGDLIKKETGKSAQETILHFVLEKAKSSLLNTEDNVSQIAYDLGYEYPQHFSKMFKTKVGISPAEYRNSA